MLNENEKLVLELISSLSEDKIDQIANLIKRSPLVPAEDKGEAIFAVGMNIFANIISMVVPKHQIKEVMARSFADITCSILSSSEVKEKIMEKVNDAKRANLH